MVFHSYACLPEGNVCLNGRTYVDTVSHQIMKNININLSYIYIYISHLIAMGCLEKGDFYGFLADG